jgi:integrase
MKWKQASAKYRKDIARALTAVTPAMLTEARGRPDDASIRRALVRWGFNTKQRPDPPDDAAQVLDWVARNTAPVSTLTEPATARQMLDLATSTVDGRNAAASTARRHRIIVANAMDYAVERGLLETNPIRVLKWTAPKVSSQVDRRSVVNPQQARALLDAVRAQQPSGPRLVAFFAVMYYAGLRPEEAINLSADNIILPPRTWDAERQLWQDPPGGRRLGRVASAHRYARRGQRMDRRRQIPGTQAGQAPGRGRHPHRPDPPRTEQAAPRTPRQLESGH